MTAGLVAAGGGSALLCSVAAVWRGAASVRSQVLAPSLWRVHGVGQRIALTFDDGPSEATPEVLRVLRAHGVRATFFLCGANVERMPEIARAVVADGHELGNHTYRHARLCPRLGWKLNLWSPGEVVREIARAQDSIERHTGVRTRLFRAPYGLRWFGVRAAQRQMGLRGVTWSVIGHDWEWGAERIAAHLLRTVRPGGIVCLHDGRDIQPQVDVSATLAALEVVLPRWRAAGLQVGTVTELLRAGAAEVRPTYAYLRALR